MASGLLGSTPVASGTDVPQVVSPLVGTFDMEGTARAWNQNAARVAAEERAKKAINLRNRGMSPFVSITNPAIRNAIQGLFNEATSSATLAPAKITATTRNPAQATKINALGQQMDTANKQATASLTEFVKQQLANRPAVQAAAAEEAAASGAYFGTGPGSVQAQLADQSRAGKAALNQAVQQAMNNARRGDSMRRMTGGNSSYNDALYADVMGRIAADSALKKSEIDRQNLMYLLEGRQRNTGVRNKILEDLARRELEPGIEFQRDAGTRSGLLSSLLNLENANTEYELDDPETRLLKKLGLIGGLTELDYARQAYEL